MGFFSKKSIEHKTIPMDKLMRHTGDIEEAAQDGVISAEEIEDLSADLGVPRDRLYAGLGMSGMAALKIEHEIQFVVCTGGCQSSGALACLSELLDRREDRVEGGEPAFDVIPKHCLNRCQSGPVVEIRTTDGTAVLARATTESVSEAVDQLFE